jgi:hypothetical protein
MKVCVVPWLVQSKIFSLHKTVTKALRDRSATIATLDERMHQLEVRGAVWHRKAAASNAFPFVLSLRREKSPVCGSHAQLLSTNATDCNNNCICLEKLKETLVFVRYSIQCSGTTPCPPNVCA